MLGVLQGSVVGPSVNPAEATAEEEIIAWIDGYASEAGPAAPATLTAIIGSGMYLLHIPALDIDLLAWDHKMVELAGRNIYVDSIDPEPTYSGLYADLYLLRRGAASE